MTDTRQRIIDFVTEYYIVERESVDAATIAKGLNISKSTVYKYLRDIPNELSCHQGWYRTTWYYEPQKNYLAKLLVKARGYTSVGVVG